MDRFEAYCRRTAHLLYPWTPYGPLEDECQEKILRQHLADGHEISRLLGLCGGVFHYVRKTVQLVKETCEGRPLDMSPFTTHRTCVQCSQVLLDIIRAQ